MLFIGMLIGYSIRPVLDSRLGAQSSKVSLASPNLPQTRDELMPFVIGQTRHFKGNPEAPVTLIEFGDFQCPFCGRHAAGAGRLIDEQYVATGKVRFGFQHFAFLGPESQWAAEANECAADQDRFWEYHDLLYANQHGENQGAFNKDKLKQLASTLGLDRAEFDTCLDSGKYTALVIRQTQTLQSLGVQSTPTFVLNGQVLVGALDFDTFQQAIELELSK